MQRDKRAKARHAAGFSMVEAMVALTIFGVGAIALMQLAPRASQFQKRGMQVSQATNLAQQKVEELRALPLTDARLTSGTHAEATINGAFQRRWVVTMDNPVNGMRKVDVRVRFTTKSVDSVAVVTTYF